MIVALGVDNTRTGFCSRGNALVLVGMAQTIQCVKYKTKKQALNFCLSIAGRDPCGEDPRDEGARG